MSVYCLFQISVQDPAKYEEYVGVATESLDGHEVNILVLDPEPKMIAGDVDHKETAIFEFASEEVFKNWYYSPKYQEALAIRNAEGVSVGRAMLLQGFTWEE